MPDDLTAAPAPRRPAERYGDRPAGSRRPAVVAVGALAAAFLAWVVWAGLGAADREVRWTDVGYTVVDDGEVTVTFDVDKDADATARCTVNALSSSYGVVGITTVDVGPADRRSVRVTASVRTQERAVTGLVDTCEVP